MRRLTVLFLSVMVAVLPVFAASKLYVAVQNAELKNSPSYFAKTVTTVDYGTQVSVVKTDGKWTQVKSGSSTGWIATSSLVIATSSLVRSSDLHSRCWIKLRLRLLSGLRFLTGQSL